MPGIQAAVNAAFEPVMTSSGHGYVALEEVREPIEGQPPVVALPVPGPYGDYGKVVSWRIDESLPDAVGAYVDWLVSSSGWTVSEKDERTGAVEQVPIEARHVCILFRRFKRFRDDVTRPYARALEVRRIPHVLVGGRSFHDQEEVLAIRNTLGAIEWPDDEFRVYAALRGPLFALGDDALLAYRDRFRRVHPLLVPDAEKLDEATAPVAEALEVLAALHRGRNRRPIADTVTRLLGAVRAHAGIAIWPTGEQALANCLRLVDVARRYERHGSPGARVLSFRGFVERLEHDAEEGDVGEAPLVEDRTDGVRIMTAHRAKGLEFPVVILADPTCRAVREQPSRHVDPVNGLWAEPLCGSAPPDLLSHADEELAKDSDEAIRLAYVAATRARDLLVVPTCGDEPMSGWFEVLDPAVLPEYRARKDAASAPGCPGFGTDSVLKRPGKAPPPDRSVAPGLHRPMAGAHDVVWWDPRALELGRELEVGLRQDTILRADEGEVRSSKSISDHEAWLAKRTETLERGSVPALRVRSATALATEAAEEGSIFLDGETVEHLEVPGDRVGRPHGKRFGILVHATLAIVDLATADEEAIRGLARVQGRLVGATDEEIDAAVVAVRAALEHPLVRRAADAGSRGDLRRETPVTQVLDDGSIAEGIVDLAFREEEGGTPTWTVVDFKTDAELKGLRARYEAQVRIYVDAIEAATGENAQGVLLSV